ncbi:MAG: hypothetical protein M1814_000684 [Vezdaea aestivalis]|nr:MAG: hypothetical protein M1814_000684 [Vezdaea aestivalis]
MLPKYLLSTYRQYKTDTDAVATWIAEKARLCGCSPELLGAEPMASKSKKASRKKGKKGNKKRAPGVAKNQQSNGANSNTASPFPSIKPKYLIPLRNFIPLAESIIESIEPAIDPSRCERNIVLPVNKKKTPDKQKDNQPKEENGHTYFVKILETIRSILQPRMPAKFCEPDTSHLGGVTAEKKSVDDRVRNLFENLELEEPSDGFLNLPPVPKSETVTEVAHSEYGIQPESDANEEFLAFQCLLEDLYRIRVYLQGSWETYKRGEIDIVAISVMTDTAIEFARCLEEEFDESFPSHPDYETLFGLLYFSICLSLGRDPANREQVGDQFDFGVYKEVKWTMIPTWNTLSSFVDAVEPGVLLSYKPGHFRVYDPSSDRNQKAPRDQFWEDQILLLETLGELQAVTLGWKEVPAQDALMRAIRLISRGSKVIPIRAIFAFQVYLDVHQIFRDQVSTGYESLKSSTIAIKLAIEGTLRMLETVSIQNWPKRNNRALTDILLQIEQWIETDQVHATHTRLARSARLNLAPAAVPFCLFKRHPLYCGLLLFDIRGKTQDAGIMFANAWGSVLYTAQLYTAVRKESLLNQSWQDMELFLQLHGSKSIFIGEEPQAMADYIKRYLLTMGYSATTFAKNRRKGNAKASDTGPRSLKSVCPVYDILAKHHHLRHQRAPLSQSEIEAILEEHIERKSIKEEQDLHAASVVDQGASKHQESVDKQQSTRSEPAITDSNSSEARNALEKVKKCAKIGMEPVILLNVLSNTLHRETLGLYFDYFSLHRNCWDLLRTVREALDSQLSNYFGPKYIEDENQLPFIVGYIFMAAAAIDCNKGPFKPRLHETVTSKLLVSSGETMGKVLESEVPTLGLNVMKYQLGSSNAALKSFEGNE